MNHEEMMARFTTNLEEIQMLEAEFASRHTKRAVTMTANKLIEKGVACAGIVDAVADNRRAKLDAWKDSVVDNRSSKERRVAQADRYLSNHNRVGRLR